MAITYTGPGIILDATYLTVYTAPPTVKAANMVGGLVANKDLLFRTLLVSADISGGRTLQLFEEVELPYGQSLTLPVVTLNAGEILRAKCSIPGVAHMTLSVGEQT